MTISYKQQPIILASASPRRKQLLEQIGLSFEVIPSAYEEGQPQGHPETFVLRTAEKKAEDVMAQVHPEKELIIAADTVVVCDGHILGKPNSQEDAKRMLGLLSDREHRVLTGVVVINSETNQAEKWVEQTRVFMRPIHQGELEDYLLSNDWQGKAGAYGIQGLAAAFVYRIEGCYFNVVGLPLAHLMEIITSRG